MRDDLAFAVLNFLKALDTAKEVVVGFGPGHPARDLIVKARWADYDKALAGLKKCVTEGPECALTFPVLTFLRLLDAGRHTYNPDRPSDHGPARVDEVNAARRKALDALRDMVGANR
jgi:hypothetical protein